MIKTIKVSDLKRICGIAVNHLDFIKRQEGSQFPESDKRIRQIAYEILASYKTEIAVDNENN